MCVGSEFDGISGAARPCAVAVADGQTKTFARDCVRYRAFERQRRSQGLSAKLK